MRVETVCTGDELLTGLTADTNSLSFQAQLLERCGLQVRRSTVVPDVRADLVEVLDAVARRSDVVLVSGGLGPTADDLTAECAAEAAGVPLEESAAALRHLEARFAQRGIELTPNNRRQALVPQGAEVVLNDEGSAPMFVQQRGACTLYFVPGVPREYRHLVTNFVIPRIEARVREGGQREVRVLRLLKTLGLPESHLDEKVKPLAAQHPEVIFGFRTHPPENQLKLMATGPTEAAARAALERAEGACRPLLSPWLYGADDDTLPGVVVAKLKQGAQTVAVAESCTGGLVSSLLTDVPGASEVFLGGAVTYAGRVKHQWAGVDASVLSQRGEVSEAVARAMAIGIRREVVATWGIATTGYAGPGGGDAQHPVGTVFIAVSNGVASRVERHLFHGDRARVRQFAASAAVDLLRRMLFEVS